MFSLIDDFYNRTDLGILSLTFMNTVFSATHQSQEWPVSNRMQAYPCYESITLDKSEKEGNPYKIFKDTFEKKTNFKILKLHSFFRKIKLEELKNSAVYKKDRPHTDGKDYDIAGLVYFNSTSLIDGTKIYNYESDFEPTAIIGSKPNRCVFYNSTQPHSSPFEQIVEERWVQPFFLVVKEETLELHKD
tara:strand:+ start:305 stop:871 length:567 start_codon:yes stop_codon:yes gene_type:complete